MRLRFAPKVLLGLAITIVAVVALRGGESMSVSYNDSHNETRAGIGLPPSDTHFSGPFETATFALG